MRYRYVRFTTEGDVAGFREKNEDKEHGGVGEWWRESRHWR
jgi:hypothetical protein